MALLNFDSTIIAQHDCQNNNSLIPESNFIKDESNSKKLISASEDSLRPYIQNKSFPISGTISFYSNDNKDLKKSADKYDFLIKDINLELYNANNPTTPLLCTTANENGYFEFNNINLDYYFIKVNLQDSNYMLINEENYTKIDSKTLLSKIIYNNKNYDTYMSIDLTKCCTICGTVFFGKYDNPVYNIFSNGVDSVSLKLYDENNNIVSSVITSEFAFIHGYYEFNNLLPGKYRIVADIPNNLKIISLFSKRSYRFKINSKEKSIIINKLEEDKLNVFIRIAR